MAKNIIIVSEEDRNNVQRADIECSARMNLISYIMRNNAVDVDNVRFKAYQDDYTEHFFAFEQAKGILEKKYLAGKQYSSWRLDYNTCELIYED